MLKPRPLDLNTVLADVGGLLQRLLGDQVELELLARRRSSGSSAPTRARSSR